jgi:hypothetical protein
MGREDFVTDPEDRYDGRGERGRMDLKPYVTRHGGVYPNPSGMILVADPAFVTDDVLTMLLAPNDDGIHPVILTDSDFEWSPPPWMHDLELRAETWEGMDQWREWCAVCHAPVKCEGLGFFWKGRPVCDECPSEEWKRIQRLGYEIANAVDARYYVEDITPGLDEWMEALAAYAAEVNAPEGQSRRDTT